MKTSSLPLLDDIESDLHTMLDWTRFATTQMHQADLYFGHGTDNAWDEAVVLVSHCLALPADLAQKTSDALFQSRLTRFEKANIYELLEQRIESREPLPYLTNQAWFCGLPFYTDKRVLIPRSPIAELIQDDFSAWLSHPPQLIMDLCTGGGCIAIAMAYAFPNAQVDALDISEEALAVANENIMAHELDERVFAIQSDVYSGVEGQKYDLIVANPPYVDAEDMADLPQEFMHEPALALAAGEDGLEIVETILQQATQHLTPQGWLFVEVGNSLVHMEHRFPGLEVEWIEFANGGEGVFAVQYETLNAYFSKR